MSTETTRNPTDPDLADIMSRLADGDMDAMGDLRNATATASAGS